MNPREATMIRVKYNAAAVKAVKQFQAPEDIGFGKVVMPAMIKCSYDGTSWGDVEVIPYAPIAIDPAAKVLHYAQEIFEGLKAYKASSGEVYLFRPESNAKRFAHSANMMGMPVLPTDYFMTTVKTFANLCSGAIGSKIQDSLYLRPFMFGDEPQLGVKPSKTYQYYLIGGPSGNYFSAEKVKVRIERKHHRAAAQGTGTAKTGGNYAASLAASNQTSSMGYDQTLWLDPVEGKYVEELSGMNFMAIINNELVTPRLNNSILHGITRDSILKIASSLGYAVHERDIEIEELLDQVQSGACTEAFACGTASVICPIERFFDKGKEYILDHSTQIAKELKYKLQSIQTGRCEDEFGWRYLV